MPPFPSSDILRRAQYSIVHATLQSFHRPMQLALDAHELHVGFEMKVTAKQIIGQLPAGLGKPAVRALHSNGILTLADLTRRSERDVASLHGIGPKAIRLLRVALNANGQSFRAS